MEVAQTAMGVEEVGGSTPYFHALVVVMGVTVLYSAFSSSSSSSFSPS
jgi:hypothetical protein